MTRTLLISIQPQYASLIFGGSKTVELRRTRPSVTRGDRVLIYVSAPDKVLRGAATIVRVVEASPFRLWTLVGRQSGISRRVFMQYYRGASRGYGLVLTNVRSVDTPRTLDDLRKRLPGFCPPQIYRYLDAQQLGRLDLEDARSRRIAA